MILQKVPCVLSHTITYSIRLEDNNTNTMKKLLVEHNLKLKPVCKTKHIVLKPLVNKNSIDKTMATKPVLILDHTNMYTEQQNR